jgi:hypothetical protein
LYGAAGIGLGNQNSNTRHLEELQNSLPEGTLLLEAAGLPFSAI